MVERFKSFKPNEKQKTYLATILAVVSGTLMYTAWQFLVPTELEIPPISWKLNLILVTGSLICLIAGYNIYTEEKQ